MVTLMVEILQAMILYDVVRCTFTENNMPFCKRLKHFKTMVQNHFYCTRNIKRFVLPPCLVAYCSELFLFVCPRGSTIGTYCVRSICVSVCFSGCLWTFCPQTLIVPGTFSSIQGNVSLFGMQASWFKLFQASSFLTIILILWPILP